MAIIKKIFSLFLRFGISAVLLWFLFSQENVDVAGILAIVRKADWLLLGVAFLVFSTAYIFCLYRWEMLLKAAAIRLSLRRVITSYAGGLFFNLFMPSSIGGDVVRSVDLSAHTKKPKEVVATVILDRLSGYIGLVLVSATAMLFGWHLVQDASVAFSLAIIFSILIVVLFVIFHTGLYERINRPQTGGAAGAPVFAAVSGIKEMLRSLHHEMHIFRHKKDVIAKNIFLSVLIQLITPVTFCIVSKAIGLKVPPIYFFVYLPIVSAITLLPISIGGLGLRDATTVFFFAKAGVGKDMALTMSLLNFVFILIVASFGGLIYVLTVHYRRVQPSASSAVPPQRKKD